MPGLFGKHLIFCCERFPSARALGQNLHNTNASDGHVCCSTSKNAVPCVGEVSAIDYAKHVQELIAFWVVERPSFGAIGNGDGGGVSINGFRTRAQNFGIV